MVDIGITYVRLQAAGGVMAIPNSQVLNAVIGPIPSAEEDAPAVVDGNSGTPGGPEKTQPAPPGSA